MPVVPKKVVDRFARGVKNFQNILSKARNRDVNEADTVTIVTDILADVFGYDKYSEITREHAVRGTYCDLAVELDGKVKFLIEVKAIGLDLKENHLMQVIAYGAKEGVDWIVLTNGLEWEIHRIRFEQPISNDLICAFNFLDMNPRSSDDQERLFLLCNEGLRKAAIEEYHERIQSVNRYTIGAVILTESITKVIRREIKRLSPGINVSIGDIEEILRTDVLKAIVVEGESADAAKKRIARVAKKALRKKKTSPTASENVPPSLPSSESRTSEDDEDSPLGD